jgi:hypothetical protein
MTQTKHHREKEKITNRRARQRKYTIVLKNKMKEDLGTVFLEFKGKELMRILHSIIFSFKQ